MKNIKTNQDEMDIKNLLDGICATNNWAYADLYRYFCVTKRTVYLWLTKNRFSKNKLLNEKLIALIKEINLDPKELIETGLLANKIKVMPLDKVIQSILLNNMTLKQLSQELKFKRGALSAILTRQISIKSRHKKQTTNFIAYKIGKYCVDNNINLDFVKNDFIFDDLRNLTSAQLKNLIYGLMKALEINTYDFEKYQLKNNTICRWLLGNYTIAEYNKISKLNNIITLSKLDKDKLILIGKEVDKDIEKLSHLFNCKVKTISFKPKTRTEQLLLSALKENYNNFTIICHPRLYKDNYRFEPDFIVFNGSEMLWFEITDVKDTSAYPGNLDMRVLRIKELFKLNKVVLIRDIKHNTNSLLRYARLLRLGINFCPINEIGNLRDYIALQDQLIKNVNDIAKNKITTGKDLRLFRNYYLTLSGSQLAALLNIKSKRTTRIEALQQLPLKITLQLEEIKNTIKDTGIIYLHQKSNALLTGKSINDKKIIKFTDFKEELEKELYDLIKQKIEVYHNVILANHDATIIAETDLYIPSKDLVILCKKSVNPSFGTIHKLIWSLQRYKRIVKHVVFYVPDFPAFKQEIFKKHGIIIVNNKKELRYYLGL